MKRSIILLSLATLLTLFISTPMEACTNLLVTKEASADGSTLITYAADSHTLYGFLSYIPARKNLPGTMINIFDWDSGKYLGKIPQVRETYQVVGNINEFQVAIGETTFGGRSELVDPEGVVDYGSLITITLQRSKTAREAVQIMGRLTEEYGYASSGESFSISDPKEAWIMELIGKGPKNKGAVWVALRIPDGYVSAHANQSRITTFPLNDPLNCLYSKEVTTFAKEKGYFKGEDKDFNFQAAYDPLDFQGLRFCEARVWSLFRRISPSLNISPEFIKGDKNAAPLPLWIKPDQKLSARDAMELMRDHYEGTELDMTKDIGAGPFALPYRWVPKIWEYNGEVYFHERAISTQQTGFSLVAQSRAWLPDPIGGILWFGVDDTYSTVYIPIYCSVNKVPEAFSEGSGSFNNFSWESAFWVFNAVSNLAYSRYSDIIPEIQTQQRELEGAFAAEIPEIDKMALSLYKKAPQAARDYLTDYSCRQGQMTMEKWKNLWETLFVKYMDGNVRDEKGNVQHPPYSESWYKAIVDSTGDRYKVPGE
ncbi:MAG: C69 family dipeptidase [Syntrophomonas sp.]